MRWVIKKGSRWFIGDWESMNVWKDRWLLREIIFKVYTVEIEVFKYMKMGELIDMEAGEWRKDMVESLFTGGDTEIILEIFLCLFWL